ncbi:MAG: hypothetical protein LAO09_19480 [Acidobacteriia bacterium]|nr:hypothetical protein [Terriglobia bacterium]
MTSEKASPHSAELLHICERLKAMGYAESRRIRIYGEEFEVVSNPFPEGNGIAVRGISTRETEVRVVKLPLPILQAVGKKKAA